MGLQLRIAQSVIGGLAPIPFGTSKLTKSSERGDNEINGLRPTVKVTLDVDGVGTTTPTVPLEVVKVSASLLDMARGVGTVDGASASKNMVEEDTSTLELGTVASKVVIVGFIASIPLDVAMIVEGEDTVKTKKNKKVKRPYRKAIEEETKL